MFDSMYYNDLNVVVLKILDVQFCSKVLRMIFVKGLTLPHRQHNYEL